MRSCDSNMQIQPVGRVFSVSHHNGELFALRRLLSVVKGAVSFEDLATVDGHIHTSFRDACKARGMLADDAEIIAALQEIVETTVSISIIRRQFVTLLIHSAPADPQAIFNYFVDDLCNPDDGGDAVDIALLEIEEEMNARHRSLEESEFGFTLPEARDMRRTVRRRRQSDSIASAAEDARMRDQILPQLTDEQNDALIRIVSAIDQDHDNKLFALISSAGCGKTIFANGLASFLRASNRSVICVAASALAAMLLRQCVETDTGAQDLYRDAILGIRNARNARAQLRSSTAPCPVCALFAAFIRHYM